MASVVQEIKKYLGNLTIGRKQYATGDNLYDFAIAVVDLYRQLDLTNTAISSIASSVIPIDILTTKGDLLTHNGSGLVREPVGSDGFIYMADSSTATGHVWNDPSVLNEKIGVAVDGVTVTGTGLTANPLVAPMYIASTTTTTSRSLALTDHRKIIRVNSASNQTITVDPEATTPYVDGHWTFIKSVGTGEVTIVPGSGAVTINSIYGWTRVEAQYGVAMLIKTGTNQWSLHYDLKLALDADAEAYITAEGITDNTWQTAINNIIIGAKADSIYSKFIVLYFLVWGSYASTKLNVVNPTDSDGAYRGTENGTISYATNGMTPNGTTGYWQTHLVPSTALTLGDHAYHVYIDTNDMTGNKMAYGAANSGTPTYVQMNPPSATYTFLNGTLTLGDIPLSLGTSNGNFTASRTTSALHTAYRAGSSIGSSSDTITALPDYEVFLGARNLNGAADFYSSYRFRIFGISTGFTGTDASNWNTRVSTFMSDLGI